MANEGDLDALDRRILDLLQEDGRKTFAEIGAVVGLSAPSAHQRVKKLESRGAIRRYTALLNPDVSGYGVLAFILVIQAAHADWDELNRAFAAIPEITECHHVAGEEDYLLKVRARDTLDLERVLRAVSADRHVDATRTMVVLSSAFEDRGLPLELLGQTGGAASPARPGGTRRAETGRPGRT